MRCLAALAWLAALHMFAPPLRGGASLAFPSVVRASGNDDAAVTGAASTSGEDAAAIRAARADLDALVATLITDHDDDDEGEVAQPREPAIQVEVTPPALGSESLSDEDSATPPVDISWLAGIELPDIPIRWNDQLLQLLRYYREDARGRAHVRAWLQRAGRYEPMIRAKLKELDLPQDLLYVPMVESGYDPTIESSAGAAGMWQLVETTASDYGVEKSRWVDQRKDAALATDAATRYLKELNARLGSWPLSLAAFNMGFGALQRSVRKYNTNDFWLLARLEAGLPYETIVYVAKIMACAIVAHNPERFGLADVQKDPPVGVALVQVPGGVGLGRLAAAASISVDALLELNPELLRKRIPPDVKQWGLHIPSDRAERFARRWPELQPQQPTFATHVLRFGERLKDVAEMYGTTERKLRALNDLADSDPVLPGARVKVPDVEPDKLPAPSEPAVVGVPGQSFHYPGRRHIYYRVQSGDTASVIAKFFHVSLDEMRAWNSVNTEAALMSGMTLQLFVPEGVDLKAAVYLSEADVRPLVVGSDPFFEYHEAQRDRVRLRYRVKSGDTLETLAQRYDLSVGWIARINGFSRERQLAEGAEIILYVPSKDKDAPKPDPRQAARD
jgi:membrane-bound lytic murein transglycosylase D